MKDEHIISLIENAPLASLSENDLTAIRAHTDHCSDCLRAFQAAQISALLLKERAAAVFEPSPFFHTRVMATLRERMNESDSWAWGRMWRAAGALASSMVATVAALAVLTFVVPGNQIASSQPQLSPLANNYSAEEVLLNQNEQLDEPVSDAQVLNTIYDADEETVR
jgi:cytochrome c-type biogenesis protein CcmH/NrfG